MSYLSAMSMDPRRSSSPEDRPYALEEFHVYTAVVIGAIGGHKVRTIGALAVEAPDPGTARSIALGMALDRFQDAEHVTIGALLRGAA